MEFDSSQPIWRQLSTECARRIATGIWPPGSRMPSVRELALELGVNPNTVQRALADLENTGLAVAERTTGRFVTSDTTLITQTSTDLATETTDAFIQQLRGLGLDQQTVQNLVARRWESAAAVRKKQ